MVAHSTWVVGDESEVHTYLYLHRKLEANLSYMEPSLHEQVIRACSLEKSPCFSSVNEVVTLAQGHSL